MLNRTTTLINTVVIAIVSIPVVWLIGYQDHPSRNGAAAAAVSLVLLLAALAIGEAGRRERPEIPRWLRNTAVIAATMSVLCTAFWQLAA